MKTRKFYFALSAVFACLFFFASCGKDDESGNGNGTPGTPTYYIKAKINGEDYSSMAVASVSGSKISVSGIGFNNATIITVSFPEGTETGSFAIGGGPLSEFSAFLMLPNEEGGTDFNFASSGNITITELEGKRVRGTFNFVAGEHTITDGTFFAELP